MVNFKMKKKTKKINWEKWLLILGVLIVSIGLVDMSSADGDTFSKQNNCESLVPSSLTQWAACNPQEIDKPDDNGEETKAVETFGLALRTQYGFDGEKCIKRDLMTKPLKINIKAVFPESWIKTHRIFEWQGDVYGYRIFPAKRARAFEKIEGHPFGGKTIREPTCDKTKIETSPLPLFWWRNSYDSNRYFQIHTIGFPHEIPFFNKVF